MAADFEERNRDKTPAAFLRFVRIRRDAGLLKDDPGVRLMTIEQARGLEFPVVFLPMFVEGEFPSGESLTVEGGVARERRIAYVGMTRATERLYITHASFRTATKAHPYRASRFIKEMIGS